MVLGTVVLSVLRTAAPLAAQCSDGSPPPCRPVVTPVPVPLDANALAILPFAVRGSLEMQYLREGMVDLLSFALDGVAGWRTVHPRTLLRRVRPGTDVSDMREAARVARHAGAATMVSGTIVVVGANVFIRAELYDAVAGELQFASSVRGRSEQLVSLIDSLALGLARQRLRHHPGVVPRSVGEYATSSPAALRAYLAGEQLARRGEWYAAADSFLQASTRDSTFGLAYFALYRAWIWGSVTAARRRVEPLLPSLPFLNRLPGRQRELLLLVQAYQLGWPMAAIRLADAIGERYPDDPEAAFQQGEAYYHLGLLLGDPPERALESFQRALQLDPGLLEPYQHVTELLVMAGDSAGAREMYRRTPIGAPRPNIYSGMGLALRSALDGEDPARLVSRDSSAMLGGTVLWAQVELLRMLDRTPARAITLADSFAGILGAEHMPGLDRVTAVWLRSAYRQAQGRRSHAWTLLQQVALLVPNDPNILTSVTIHPLITGTHGAEGRAAADRLAASDSAGFEVLELVGLTAAVDRDTSRLEAVLGEIARRSLANPPYAAALRSGLRGVRALEAGDSIAAYDLLTEAVAVNSGIGSRQFHFTELYFPMRLARLARARGALAQANQLLQALSGPEGIVFRAEAEELQGQIAEQRGDTPAAIRAYRTFIDLWKDADPELQPRVQAARAALTRLES